MTHTPTAPAIDLDVLRRDYREAAAKVARLRAKLASLRDAGGMPRRTVTVDKRTAELVEPRELVTLPVAHLRMLFQACALDGLSRGFQACVGPMGDQWGGVVAEAWSLAERYTDTAVNL